MKSIEIRYRVPYAQGMDATTLASIPPLPWGPVPIAGPTCFVHGVAILFAGTERVGRMVGDIVNMQPDPTALPGGQVLQSLMNGLQSWALALSLIGLVIGAAAWALGSHGQNYQQTFVGRRAVLISGLAALLIGAGPGIVTFFFNAGTGVH